MGEHFDLYKKKIMSRGATTVDRMVTDKQNSFNSAINLLYNAEDLIKDGETYKGIISAGKIEQEKDVKSLAIANEANFQVGDLFLWERTQTRWLVITKSLTERAYFRGEIVKTNHKLKWKDDNGVVYEEWAYIRGPVETKIKVEGGKRGLQLEVPNDTLTITMPDSEKTKCFKRHFRFILKDRAWEITSFDNITTPGIIELQLIENYVDNDRDDEDIAGGKVDVEYKITSSLDELSEVQVGTPIDLRFTILKNGEVMEVNDLSIKSNFEIDVIENNTLTFSESGTRVLTVEIPSIAFVKEYVIEVKENNAANIITYSIIGPEKIKCFGEQEYVVQKTINGQQVTDAKGTWSIDNISLAEILSFTNSSVIIDPTGEVGKITLSYDSEDGFNITKDIKITSLFG